MAIALQHCQAGRFEAAEQIFRQILQVRPDYAVAHNNLGNVLQEKGRLEEAAACYRRALELRPDYARAHSNLGGALQAQGKLDEAVRCYQRALELTPDLAEAHHNLGVAFQGQGRSEQAAACYRRAIQIRPDYIDALNGLGNLWRDQQPPQGTATVADWPTAEEALACFRRVAAIRPDDAGAQNNLASALWSQGKLDDAVACLRRVLALAPERAEAHNTLGIALRDQGKPDEAIACYQRAVQLKPDYAEAHSNLGAALHALGRLDEAIACCRRTLRLNPACIEAHGNLGAAFYEQGKLEEAIACYRRTVDLAPDRTEAQFNLGIALHRQGKLDEAVDCFRRILQLDPDCLTALGTQVHYLQHMCRWEELQRLSQRVIEGVDNDAPSTVTALVPPFFFLALPRATTAGQQLRCSRQWAERRLKAAAASVRNRASNRSANVKSKVTIAYLSADFHSHATASLIAELFERHDRGRFAIVAYSYGPEERSPMRRRLVDAFDRFVDVKDTSFAETAARISADGVDILVDLKGYTTDARPPILVHRPAPIQVNYLGYPGTMGASFMDYILVDDFIVPPQQQPFFAEQLVHLPGCYQVNDGQREISPRTPSRAECGLPAEGFVFCCFNNNYKITAEVFGVWMKLLLAVPGSVLWLLEDNRFAAGSLRQEAAARGVAAERLIFAPRLHRAEHLARHRAADLFLDTLPVNAHTTASDALWTGCPVLTIAGETFVSRVAGSLLRSIGLPELITTSLDDYEHLALRLANDAALLAELRSRLISNRATSSLFDAGRFARNLEKAYLTMWETHRSGRPPQGFAVSEP